MFYLLLTQIVKTIFLLKTIKNYSKNIIQMKKCHRTSDRFMCVRHRSEMECIAGERRSSFGHQIFKFIYCRLNIYILASLSKHKKDEIKTGQQQDRVSTNAC